MGQFFLWLTVDQQVCAYSSIFVVLSVAVNTSRRCRVTERWFSACLCLQNTDGSICKRRHEVGERKKKTGVGDGWAMIIQVEAENRVERAQSVPELKGKIMGESEATRWRAAIEVEWENTRKIQWIGREWAELRERAVYQREEGSQRERERERDCNRREGLNRRGWVGMGEEVVGSETDSDKLHNG